MVLPMLRYLLALRGRLAGTTALAVTFFASFAGLLSYSEHRYVLGGFAVAMAVGQFFGAAWGQRLAASVPIIARMNVVWAVLVVLVGLLMSANALGIVSKAALGQDWQHPARPAAGIGYWAEILITSAVVGFVSRVIALGGVLLVPAELYFLHFIPEDAQGTALLVLALASLPSVLIHFSRRDLEPQSATWMSVGGVFGALLGAFCAVRVLPAALLVLIYGVVLTLTGLTLLWRGPGSSPETSSD